MYILIYLDSVPVSVQKIPFQLFLISENRIIFGGRIGEISKGINLDRKIAQS